MKPIRNLINKVHSTQGSLNIQRLNGESMVITVRTQGTKYPTEVID